MTTEMPAVCGGELACYIGSLIEQIARLEAEVAELQARVEAEDAPAELRVSLN